MTGAQDIRSRAATTLVLLCGMNLLDYIDRNILAAVLPKSRQRWGYPARRPARSALLS